MITDVLGREELEAFDVDLSMNDITLLSTRCCSTGTCDGPNTIMPFHFQPIDILPNELCSTNAYEIYKQLGPIRA